MTQKRILIYLYAEKASWLVIDESGQIQQTVLQSQLTELSSVINGHEIQVIVPGEFILLTSVSLPKLNAQRLKQALPFALEEQLIDDIGTLHFATGDYQSNNSYPVAIVAKDIMDEWMDRLQQANITPHALIPAPLTLPFATDSYSICIDEDMAIARTDAYVGFTCDKENLATLLSFQLAQSERKTDFIHVYNFTQTPSFLNFDSVAINETAFKPDEFLHHLLKWRDTFPVINLLQGDYQATKKTTATKKIWIAASCIALGWVIFSLISNIGSYFILHHATANTEQQINTIYKRHFPQATNVVAPRQRMEEKLKKLSGSATKNNFLATLGAVGNLLPKAKGIQLLSFDYRGNQLTLSVNAMSFDHLDSFTQSLTHEHLVVKQQNASMAGTTVKANLQISQGAL